MGGRSGRVSRRRDSSPAQFGPELIIGLVGALGTDLDHLTATLEEGLGEFRYETHALHLSDYLREFPDWRDVPRRPYDVRIEALQDAGNELRARTGIDAAMAGLALAEIQDYRKSVTRAGRAPVPRTAYILRSLKHPAEAELLRSVYGAAFVLIAAYAPIEERRKSVTREIARSRHGMPLDEAARRADVLIGRDDHEPDRSDGQLVRDTFPRADAFVAVHRPDEAAKQVARVLDLLFGHPFQTPTRDEFAMFQAHAAALRSADLGRQVGAAIVGPRGEVVSLGTNEVPKACGGQYWASDEQDRRDFQLGRSESSRIRRTMFAELLLRLRGEGWLDADLGSRLVRDLDGEVDKLLPIMRGTALMGIGEFGRTVHAEMAALLDAARRGVPVDGCTVFSTTFPCHNCTKHLVAAGIRRVVYVEPYPKSRAAELHDDSIVVDPGDRVGEKVRFEPFVGVAPRRYIDFFTMPERQEEDGSVRRFTKRAATPRVPLTSSYVEAEEVEVRGLYEELERAELRPAEAEPRRERSSKGVKRARA